MALFQIHQHTISLTHPDKLLYPNVGITKLDVMNYYERIASWIVPHTESRPLSLHRFPHGVSGEGFFQKNIPESFPEWVHVVPTPKKEGHNMQAVGDNAETLVYLSSQYSLEFHGWLSRYPKLRYPDKIVFDIDPPHGGDMSHVVSGARLLRVVLESLGFHPFVMSSGSRGLHVAFALDQSVEFSRVKLFARQVATCLSARYPDIFTVEFSIAKRGKRIFFDFLRNEYAQTSIVPYSLRARAAAPVATPLEWDELHDHFDPQHFTLKNISRRLGQRDDPWRYFFHHPVSLSGVEGRLRNVLQDICPTLYN